MIGENAEAEYSDEIKTVTRENDIVTEENYLESKAVVEENIVVDSNSKERRSEESNDDEERVRFSDEGGRIRRREGSHGRQGGHRGPGQGQEELAEFSQGVSVRVCMKGSSMCT